MLTLVLHKRARTDFCLEYESTLLNFQFEFTLYVDQEQRVQEPKDGSLETLSTFLFCISKLFSSYYHTVFIHF